ncbi:hypothetical protein FQZ97_906680 [compost metagenome]
MAAADDQFLLAPGQPEIPVAVLPSHVAGVEPALAVFQREPHAAVVLVLQVAAKDVGPTDGDDADLVGFAFAKIVALCVQSQHAHLLVRKAQPDGADARFAGQGVEAAGARPFGQAVAFQDADARALFEATEELHRHRCSTTHAQLERAKVKAFARLLQQGRIDRGDAAEEVDAVVLDHSPETFEHAGAAIAVRGAEHDMGAYRPGCQPGDQLAVRMEQGQAAEQRLSGPKAVGHHAGHCIRIEHFVQMLAHGDLRQTGRATGTEIRGH